VAHRLHRAVPFGWVVLFGWVVSVLHAGLAGSAIAQEAPAVFPGENWTPTTPAEAGLDQAALESARDYALTGDGSGIIVRGGKVVLTWGDQDVRYDLKSTTKSFGSIALGLAIGDGLVKLDDPAVRYEFALATPPEENRQTGWIDKITLYHLATQTAGFEKPGGYNKLLFAPGTRWKYSDAGPNWLADCLTLVYQRDLNDLMFERVFTPIGIGGKDLAWRKNQYRAHTIAVGTNAGTVARREFGAGISANVDAMARIGLLMLRQGKWQDRQIIPADYVRSSTRPQPAVSDLAIHEDPDHEGAPARYGLLWWTNGDGTLAGVPTDAYWSWGLYDSLIVVIPSKDLVIARAGKSWKREKGAGHYKVLEPFLVPIAKSAGGDARSAPKRTVQLTPPYPPSAVIGGMKLDWATHRREAPGSDNWQMTWADDDHQYAPWGDGGGFGGTNSLGRASLGVARIEGPADDYRGVNVYGGKDGLKPSTINGKSWGIISVGGVLYMWVSPGSPLKVMQQEARLYSSRDHGESWTPADWAFTFADQLTIPTICQFGRDYAGAIDDYVYHYFIHPRDNSIPDLVQKPGTLYLARCPSDKLLDRQAYTFYTGVDSGDVPVFTRDIKEKKPVFENPNGVGWCMSATYNAGLKRFLLLTQHGDKQQGMLGVFDASSPWGPWTTMTYLSEPFTSDRPAEGLEVPANTFFWNIPPKWQSADGLSFTMVFTGAGRGKDNDSFNAVGGRFVRAGAPADKPAAPPPVGTLRVEWAPPGTVVRDAAGSDNWPMTWADDDHQYTAFGDGWGFEKKPGEKKLSVRIARIEGAPPAVKGIDIPAPTIEATGDDVRGQKASGMLCVEGVLYAWLRNAGNSVLAWSKDHGKTWERADWKFTTSFGCPTFLNAGRDYAGAADDFVYVYSFDADSAYTPADGYVLARVARGRIRDRSAYEFFAGRHADKDLWSPDIAKRRHILENPGRCYRLNVTYVPPLKRYLLVQTILARGAKADKGLAIYDSPTPFGPWTTAFYAEKWDIDAGDSAVIPAKWIGADGKSAYLVFAGEDNFCVRKMTLETGDAKQAGR